MSAITPSLRVVIPHHTHAAKEFAAHLSLCGILESNQREVTQVMTHQVCPPETESRPGVIDLQLLRSSTLVFWGFTVAVE